MKIKGVLVLAMMVSASIGAAPTPRSRYQGQGKATIRAAQKIKPQKITYSRSPQVPQAGHAPQVRQSQPALQAPQRVAPPARNPMVTNNNPPSLAPRVPPAPSGYRSTPPVDYQPNPDDTDNLDVLDDEEYGEASAISRQDKETAINSPRAMRSVSPEEKQQMRETLEAIKKALQEGDQSALTPLSQILRDPILSSIGVNPQSIQGALKPRSMQDLLHRIDEIIAQIPEIKRTWFQSIKSTAWNNSGLITSLAGALLIPPVMGIAQGYVTSGILSGFSAIKTWWVNRRGQSTNALDGATIMKLFPQSSWYKQEAKSYLSTPYQSPVYIPQIPPVTRSRSVGDIDLNVWDSNYKPTSSVLPSLPDAPSGKDTPPVGTNNRPINPSLRR